jgi:hypothetical protein
MLEKVRKLLAMGRDGRGNENEQEIAMRQANRLMAEFGIAEAECDMAALAADEMVFGESQCGPDGRAPEQGTVYRSTPLWAGILSVGVARFCDAIVSLRDGANGRVLVFRGEREDVLLARWVFGVLVDSIQRSQKASGWTKRGEANTFRVAAAGTLQTRLKALAAERMTMYQEAKRQSNSRALVVVDRKRAEIARRFGTQKTSATRSHSQHYGAAQAGSEAGRNINIPAGRPVGNASRTMLN